MGGVADFLFGSKSKVKEPKLQVRKESTFSDQQRQLADFLGPLLRERAGDTVEPSPLETTSLAGLEQLALSAVGGADGVSGGETTEAAGSALRDVLSRGPTDFQEFFEETVQRPALEQFQEEVIPQIRTRFAPQFFGGERAQAEERATEDLLDALTQARAGLAFQIRQQDVQNILSAAGLAPEFAGIEERNVRQNILPILTQALQGGIAGRRTLSEEEQRRIRDLLQFLGIPQIENIAATGQVVQGREGLLQSAARGAAAAATAQAF